VNQRPLGYGLFYFVKYGEYTLENGRQEEHIRHRRDGKSYQNGYQGRRDEEPDAMHLGAAGVEDGDEQLFRGHHRGPADHLSQCP
jgi:hypothetical protein